MHRASCDSCRRRKLRCDRRKPCSNCAIRKASCVFPEACQTSPSSAPSHSQVQLLSPRLRARFSTLAASAKPLSRLWAGGEKGVNDQRPICCINTNEFDSISFGETSWSCHRLTLGPNGQLLWLPTKERIVPIVQAYLRDYSEILGLINPDLMITTLAIIYRDIHTDGIPASLVVLVLGVLANTLFLQDVRSFSAAFWVTQTEDLVYKLEHTPGVTIELLQGLLLANWVTACQEADLRRYRLLHDKTLSLARRLGLHMENGPERTMNIESQVRSRIWWYLVATDWHLTAWHVDGTPVPYSCHPAHTSIPAPSPLDWSVSPSVEAANDPPTRMTYFVLRLRLANIMRTRVDIVYQSSADLVDNRESVDGELRAFLKELPQCYRIDEDKEHEPYVSLHRYFINMLFATYRCSIHSPWGSEDFDLDQSSWYKCLEAASLAIRNELLFEASGHTFAAIRLGCPLMLRGFMFAILVVSLHRYLDIDDVGCSDMVVSTTTWKQALDLLEKMSRHSASVSSFTTTLKCSPFWAMNVENDPTIQLNDPAPLDFAPVDISQILKVAFGHSTNAASLLQNIPGLSEEFWSWQPSSISTPDV